MKINIRVFKEPGAEPESREAESGTKIYELYNEYRSHLPYRIYTARINSEDVPLTQALASDCDLTFCDIRDDVAFRSFQRGLTLLLLKAVRELYGKKAKVMIRNSVNRGLFTSIAIKEPGNAARTPDNDELRQIEKRMWMLVDANKPIIETGDGVYKLEGFTCMLYGLMPPSTGGLFPFALEPMRGGVLLRYPHPSEPQKLALYRRDVRVFDAYEEEQEFLDGLHLGNIIDLNRKIMAGGAEEIIKVAEDRHSDSIRAIARYILISGKKVVLLAGPSSSGKTTTAKRLIEAFADEGAEPPLYFGTDDYYVNRVDTPKDKKGEYNYEGLDAIDLGLFANNIEDLLDGKTADLPRYDFIKGVKVFGERKARLKKGQVIIVEGIHALNKKFSAAIDDGVKFKLYISPLTQLNIDDNNRIPSTDVRLLRRMVRDNRTRGKTVSDTIKMWPNVRAAESVNIFPNNNEADVVFNSTLVYELPVLKKHVLPLLEEVPANDAAYGTAKRLIYFLESFVDIDDESTIPCDSVLREFIGGSRFDY